MATKSSVADLSPQPSTANPPNHVPPSANPSTPPAKLELPASDSKKPSSATTTPRQAEPSPPPEAQLIHIPSYSRWFSWNNIHDCEVRFLPEFFDSRSPSKNPSVYKYFRNSIVKRFRDNPSCKITFTDVRKTLVGDVGSIRRVFDFLEAWGLINYSPSAVNKPLKWEDKEAKSVSHGGEAGGGSSDSPASNREASKRVCSSCKSNCTIACFACDKHDLTLCARCYVRGNYRVGVSSSDFRRVEISEETRSDWTDKETLHLFEAVMHYGDDWRKVAQHVGGKTEKDCVSHFVKLPFGEQFVGYTESRDIDNKYDAVGDQIDADDGLAMDASSPIKRMRLTPLADASNPIMAQAAFLSSLAGIEVAEAAARAAVTKLSEIDYRTGADVATEGDITPNAVKDAFLYANSRMKKEESDVEAAISEIIDVQMKEIQDKLVRIENLDLHIEKEWQQLEQMKSMLFVDQLSLLLNKSRVSKTGEDMDVKNVRTD